MTRWIGCLPLFALSLLLTGCYNDPAISDKFPGQGTKNIHRGPDVGPGRVSGGSTAGHQPEKRAEEPEKH